MKKVEQLEQAYDTIEKIKKEIIKLEENLVIIISSDALYHSYKTRIKISINSDPLINIEREYYTKHNKTWNRCSYESSIDTKDWPAVKEAIDKLFNEEVKE